MSYYDAFVVLAVVNALHKQIEVIVWHKQKKGKWTAPNQHLEHLLAQNVLIIVLTNFSQKVQIKESI